MTNLVLTLRLETLNIHLSQQTKNYDEPKAQLEILEEITDDTEDGSYHASSEETRTGP